MQDGIPLCKCQKRYTLFDGELRDARVFSSSDSGTVFSLLMHVYAIRSNVYLPRLPQSIQTMFLFLFHSPHLISVRHVHRLPRSGWKIGLIKKINRRGHARTIDYSSANNLYTQLIQWCGVINHCSNSI